MRRPASGNATLSSVGLHPETSLFHPAPPPLHVVVVPPGCHPPPPCRPLVEELLYYARWAGAFTAGGSAEELAHHLGIQVRLQAPWVWGQKTNRA
jgi:hypothetical protein